MAILKLSRKENEEGNFFVDNTCIDCGTCYWVAPKTFDLVGDMSAVVNQPIKKADAIAAYRAMYSCPTNSIGVKNLDPLGKKVLNEMPYVIHGDVYHTGFHAEESYGAASYFIHREKGNVLIDCPSFSKKLATRFQLFGGIEYQLLTHKDDVADTDKFWNKFQSKRMIHKDDITENSILWEEYFHGEDEILIDADLIAIPVPGHTKGSVCFLYKKKYLFTGDHLAYSPELGHLFAFKRACWYDFDKQIESMEKLLHYDFEYVLPGHGAPVHGSVEDMKDQLKKCIEWMKN